jgi:organic radical activating enzyme
MAAEGANVSEVFVSLQGEGVHAGRRHLFVRFAGCPLRCRWCDTPESLAPVAACRVHGPDGAQRLANPLPLDVLDGVVARLERAAPPLHALAVTGGEPLAQVDFLAAWLPVRRTRLPVLLETAGIRPDRLRRLLSFVAIASLDLKCPSNSGERPLWDEHEACVAAAVEAGVETYVKMPVDAATSDEDVERGMRIAAAHGVPAFLTPIVDPASPAAGVDAGALDRLHAVATRVHADVRVLPQLHKILGVR